ncbi:MAG: arsenosugar biosynthesis radical SAM protein ArsS [bacterium]|nr:arsenosugar biosynthesis radical SAM protein ArsS [bacterium]
MTLPIISPRHSAVPDGFAAKMREANLYPLSATGIETLQVNVGKLCNQTCTHCHVDAGPDRREIMPREVFLQCLRVLDQSKAKTVDITGGAPELNPHFRWFVEECRARGLHVIDRCNLTILLTRPHEELAAFLARHRVEIIASLPCYTEANTDAQRGVGVFRKSIDALVRLNDLGYGHDQDLQLNLVYNPAGEALPPDQAGLERDYKEQLARDFGIVFNRLFCITNMPVGRFRETLLESGRYEEYLARIASAFNPCAAKNVMCRSLISVDWQGFLYDCDFNQMLDLRVNHGLPAHINDWTAALNTREIVISEHCFGCTAGAGSSCSGAVT